MKTNTNHYSIFVYFLHTVYYSSLLKLINNNSIITFSLMQAISVIVSLTFTGLVETLSLPVG